MTKKILFFLCCAMTVIAGYAQGSKTVSLEDVMPGGKNYQSYLPANPNLKWWGDVRVEIFKDRIDLMSERKRKFTITLKDVQTAIEKVDAGIKINSLSGATLLDGKSNLIRLSAGNYYWSYDYKKKVAEQLFEVDPAAANADFCTANRTVAYTVGNKLYVSSPKIHCLPVNPEKEEVGIVYGQSVHRNEFGIEKGTFWSPKGRALAYYRMDQSMVNNYPQVNTTTRIATMVPDPYPMAGLTSHKVSVGVFDVATHKIVYLKTGDPTDRYFTNVSWSPDEKYIYLIELNRGQDEAQLVKYDATNGNRLEVLYEEKHQKYVEPQHPLIFLPWNDNQFIYQSQRDGFNHLYLFDLSKKGTGEWQKGNQSATYMEKVGVTQLTKGDWLVTDVLGFNAERKTVYFTSSEKSPLDNVLAELNIATGEKRLLGVQDGWHSAQLNESGTAIIDKMVSVDVPRLVSLIQTATGKSTKLQQADDPLASNFRLPEINVGTIKAADGVTELYYRLVKPLDFDPNKKYPAIIYVYGGPHAQMIRNGLYWSARGWDLYMASRGYVILTVDNRGSANRGLNFENVIHRQLGVEEMKDQMKGVELLKSLPYVDVNRLGVHGWSFGGFMTTNLMLTYPDTFKVGVAGGPVIDWEYYEVMYGERYMDRPAENPKGYRNANLKLKAGNLKGRLMVIHGGMDPTCVPQHSYTFLRACIDAGTHPDFFVYPEDGHNMFGRDRVHLYEHITRYFDDYLK